jgi:hypothetical protein
MHFTNLALILSADDADSADKKWKNLRQSVKSADKLVRCIILQTAQKDLRDFVCASFRG